jgi:cytochrome c biogenesis protein CcmG, thiol:disulfide interchange protein DsbE
LFKKNLKFAQIALLFFLLQAPFQVFSQNNLPTVKVKDLKGTETAFSELFEQIGDTAVIVSFWATWCGPCIKELEAIGDNLEEWTKTTPLKVYAVSIDDSRTAGRVKSFVKGKGWGFQVYQDINNDLKRALNIPNIPHALIVKNKKIIYRHEGYLPGNEEELIEKIRNTPAGK